MAFLRSRRRRRPTRARSFKRRRQVRSRRRGRSVRPRFGVNKPIMSRINPKTFGVSQYLMVKLKYCFTKVVTTGLGALETQQFRGNSIFDPDLTGVGNQPRYRDEYAAMYKEYRVFGARFKVTYINRNGRAAQIWTYTKTDTGILGTKVDLQELTKFSVLSTDQKRITKMSKYHTTQGIFNTIAANDETTAAIMGGNPDKEWFFNVAILNLDPAIALEGNLDVCITYYVRFENPVFAAQS